MKILKDLQNAFHDFINSLEAFFLSFVHPLLLSIKENGGKVLIDAAIAAVAAAETSGGDGNAKMAAAEASVVETLTKEGIPVVKNAIRGAIEAAVASLRAETT